jgi:hypothetical protein
MDNRVVAEFLTPPQAAPCIMYGAASFALPPVLWPASIALGDYPEALTTFDFCEMYQGGMQARRSNDARI